MMVRHITPPADEPFTLAQARRYLRIDGDGYTGDTSRDADIVSWIKAARRYAENATDTSIGIQTLQVVLDGFSPGQWPTVPSRLVELPLGPVIEIVSIEYLDPEGTEAIVDPEVYRLTVMPPQCVSLRRNQRWPEALCEPESVRITYRAGYDTSPTIVSEGSADSERVGDDVLQAMRFLLGLYATQTSAAVPIAAQELPLGVQALLWPNRASVGI